MKNNPSFPLRALVISGGGSKGAFAGGVAEYLLRQCAREYDLFIGTSAGSLLAPLLALGEVDRLKTVFTSIRQGDIFNICPFIIRRRNGLFIFRINHFNTARMFLRGKKTFGRAFTDNSFIFDPEQMRTWWEEGARHAAEMAPACHEIG